MRFMMSDISYKGGKVFGSNLTPENPISNDGEINFEPFLDETADKSTIECSSQTFNI